MEIELENQKEKFAQIVSFEVVENRLQSVNLEKNQCLHFFWLHVSQEKEIAELEKGIKNEKEGNLAEENEILDKLLVENSKLKFRLDILNRVSFLC